jgi:hypothetical protein
MVLELDDVKLVSYLAATVGREGRDCVVAFLKRFAVVPSGLRW